MLPSIFLSHGAPTLPITESPARDFLAGFAPRLPRPKAILVASAHWDTPVPAVNAVSVNDTIHDFRGFPDALYGLRYPAPGSPALAERVSELLTDAGLEHRIERGRGLDHGAWVPLLLMYPEADIPVVQLSVQSRLGPAHHFALGRALAPLRAEDVLIVGSGSFTHNLHEFFGAAADEPEPDWVTGFADWFDRALVEGRTQDLLDYRRRAPAAARNHPTEEHLLPLYVALGAAPDGRASRLHASADRGVLRLDAYAFGEEPALEVSSQGTAAQRA